MVKTSNRESSAFFKVKYILIVRGGELRVRITIKSFIVLGRANYETILKYITGIRKDSICKNCKWNGWPFAEHVTLPGKYAKPCINYHYNCHGK